MKIKVDICVSLFNEERNLPELLSRYQSARIQSAHVGNLVLVDNGSSDGTWRLLRKFQSEVILISNLPKNQGYGGGAISAISNSKSPFISLIPANNQYPIDRIVELIDEFCSRVGREGSNLLLKGRRVGRNDPVSIRVMSFFNSVFMSVLIGRYVRDINGLPKIFNKELILKNLENLPKNASFDAALLRELKIVNVSFLEMPISYLDRKHGQASWTNRRVKTSLDMILTILRYRFRR